MRQLHLTLHEDSPAIRWANDQADKAGARGHVGTHIDCYTVLPAHDKYTLPVLILDCRHGMPSPDDIRRTDTLDGMALALRTGNLGDNRYGTDDYFRRDTSLSPETLEAILSLHPVFIIIDSHGIAEKGEKHIAFDKQCEHHGCHVIENADLTPLGDHGSAILKILIDISYPSSGKPCALYLTEY